MGCIGIVKDENFGLKSKKMTNPSKRIGARGIVIRKDGKIAIFNKTKKNEYKLPGGGVKSSENIRRAFEREVLEETGCKIKIIEKLGTIEEHKSLENFKQISHIFVAEVKEENKKLNLTNKEKNEGAKLIWVDAREGLELITQCIDNLKPSKYENLYNSKFIVLRDKIILEFYLNKSKSNNQWHSLYKKYIKEDFKDWDQYFRIKMKLKKKFFKQVIKFSKTGKPILECGCGTGKSSVYLSTLGLKTYAMDIEEAMVEETRKLSYQFCSDNQVNVIKGDIKKIPFGDKYFSVAHSSGVLEHFSDQEIIKLINEQLRVSDTCIFSVPTKYFEKKMLGNERFMSRKQWRKIILQSNAIIIKETGYHYKTLNKRILDIIKKPKRLFKPIALYIFVLKERDD